ncbi:hypothetical protein H696_01998, partial [Fonticula alba]
METDMIHKLYLRSQKYKKLMEEYLTDEVIPTSKTCLDTTIFCHRQERNVHGKLFGGYLMRHAFELAFCTALTYTGGAMPIFLGQDEIQFKKPVEIGSLLSFKSRIELAEGSTGDNPNASQFQVEVMADVIDPATGDRDTTNVFHYTFQVPNKPLRTVVPQTYEEFMAYVMAQRRRSNSAAVFKHYQGKISTWTIPVPDRLHWHDIGKILEDLDGFAGSVAYTHCQRHLLTSTPASADSEAAPSETNLSATIVTAAVNQIMLLNQIRAERDMRMTGHVSWVGRSSLDVRIMVESLVADPSAPAPAAGSKPTPNTDPNANWEPLVMADFTMVALDPNTRKATVVPRLELKNALENDIFSHGQ